MTQTVLQICTDAARIINMIDEVTDLSPEQGTMALTALNEMLLDMAEDGIELGWYAQSSLSNTAPLQDSDLRPVKLVLGRELAMRAGLTPALPQEIKDEMDLAYDRLSKRTVEYFESDMTGLPVPQGNYWGGGRGL